MLTIIFAGLAAVVHVYIFCLESLWWGKPKTNRLFRVSPAEAETNRLFAFNQGFYNLFLGAGVFAGLCFGARTPFGRALIIYALTSMLCAAFVLIYSNKKMLRSAMIQGLAPFLGLLFIGLGL